MKKLLPLLALFALLMSGLTSCYKDVNLPEGVVDPDGPPQQVSYKTDIAPMLTTRCAIGGCHVTGAHKPFLTVDISYLQIVNGGFVNTLIPKESTLYKMINGEMKEYIPAAADRQKIYDWIRTGALNN